MNGRKEWMAGFAPGVVLRPSLLGAGPKIDDRLDRKRNCYRQHGMASACDIFTTQPRIHFRRILQRLQIVADRYDGKQDENEYYEGDGLQAAAAASGSHADPCTGKN